MNSMAAQREVQRMSLRPYSRQQKLAQIAELHRMATRYNCWVDCDIRINTPEFCQGGISTFSTEVEITV